MPGALEELMPTVLEAFKGRRPSQRNRCYSEIQPLFGKYCFSNWTYSKGLVAVSGERLVNELFSFQTQPHLLLFVQRSLVIHRRSA